ncbi:MAG: SH3 domain-containing protein [Xanthobacteraceae bacterium]|jgi:SH3-like domain-containing protein
MVQARVKPRASGGRRLFLSIPATLAALLVFGHTFGPASSLLWAPAWAGSDVTSGLPVPRFVSLKADRVTVRGGPDKDHDVAWVYTRAGWPVEITAEFENWRRVRDCDGAEGWVYHSLLTGKRTAAVQLKTKTDLALLYQAPDAHSGVVARLQVGVLGSVKHCTGTWCQISGDGFAGWVEQSALWGVYPGEKIE